MQEETRENGSFYDNVVGGHLASHRQSKHSTWWIGSCAWTPQRIRASQSSDNSYASPILSALSLRSRRSLRLCLCNEVSVRYHEASEDIGRERKRAIEMAWKEGPLLEKAGQPKQGKCTMECVFGARNFSAAVAGAPSCPVVTGFRGRRRPIWTRRTVALRRCRVEASVAKSESCVALEEGAFADEEDYIKAGGSELYFVQMQQNKTMENQSRISDKVSFLRSQARRVFFFPQFFWIRDIIVTEHECAKLIFEVQFSYVLNILDFLEMKPCCNVWKLA